MIKIKYLLITLLIIISVLNCQEDNEKNMKSTEFKGWIFFNVEYVGKYDKHIDITIPLESGDVKLSGSNIITYEINRNYFIEDKNNYFPDYYTEVLKISRLVDTQNNKDYILRKTFVKQSNGVLVKDYSEYFSPNGKPTKLLASQNDIIGKYQWSPNEKYNVTMNRIDKILGSGIFLNFIYFNDLFNNLKVYDLNKTLPNRENTGIFRTIKLYNYFYYVSYNRDTSSHELSDLEDSANHRTEFETGKPLVEMKYVDEFFDYVRNYKKIIKGLK